MKMRSLGAGAVVVAVLLLMTPGTLAGGLSGSWGRAFKMEPQLAALVRGENPASDQIFAPFGEERFGIISAAPKSKIEGCPAPCEAPKLTFTGSASGIGASDGILTIQGAGFPIVTCYNPGGGSSQAPPGINKVPLLLTSEKPFSPPASVSKNGKAPVVGSVGVAQFPPLDAAVYCPNGNWTAEVTNVLWVAGLVSLEQDGNILCEVTVFAGTQQYLTC